jgi:enoyl-CoA hydratase/carnithine racemase
MPENVATSLQQHIFSIRIDRPEKKNALTRAMYLALMGALRRAEEDADVRVIVLTGGEECFTAGNDLADFAAARPNEAPVALEYLRSLAAAKKPVIAAVAGVAIGIGTTMLLHCDLVYAAENARFQLPFVNLGLCPEAASSFILPMTLGRHPAAELLMFGEPFGAEAARHLGLVNYTLKPHELMPKVMERAQQLAEKPPDSLRTTKVLLKSGMQEAITRAMDRETEQFARLLQGPEAKEALSAFLERRKPDFSKF